ncbi:MAG: B12-binding domain-containing radical SAM protein [Spirochaetota bacterium]
MNILLVYPEYPDTFWSFRYALRFVSAKAAFPPLGLLTVASLLPKEWNKRVIDLNVSELTDDCILWADMVFISAMIVQKESAKEIIKRCKDLRKTVVAGGPYFSSHYEEFANVDHLVLNEAEITLPLFLKDLLDGKARQIYRSEIKPDLKDTPLPMWSLINTKNYISMSIQYSRGCPFNCEFCDIIVMNGRAPRTKTADQILRELDALYSAGWHGSVFIVDDNFIGNKRNVKQLLPEIINWQKLHRYPFKFMTEASINLADDEELMQMMSLANFHKVFLGIETPCIESLKETGKLQNTTRNLNEVIKTIQRNGMQVMGGFIVGFDNDPENIFDVQTQFIQKSGVVFAMVAILNALPQTRLWYRLKAEGRLLSATGGEATDGSFNFIPKMGKAKLLAGYKKILSIIYSPRQYYQRIFTFLANYKPTARGGKFCFSYFKAFFTSIWRIGVLSNTRWLYWKLIFTTIFTKMKALPTVVEYAINGFHFAKIAEKVIKVKELPQSSRP